MSKRIKGSIRGPFVPLRTDIMKAPAWRRTSHGAKYLYVLLRSKLSNDHSSNGKLFLSYRNAQKEMRSGFASIAGWFRELQHYGFIVMTSPGCLGFEGRGKAPHWRLTEVGTAADPLPTNDFNRWDGAKFKNQKSKPRYRNAQRTATEKHSGRVPRKAYGTLPTATEKRSISTNGTVTETDSISSLTTPPTEGAAELHASLARLGKAVAAR
jgi:hypothetical protein